jgi:hypothetical protein
VSFDVLGRLNECIALRNPPGISGYPACHTQAFFTLGFYFDMALWHIPCFIIDHHPNRIVSSHLFLLDRIGILERD